MALKQYGVQFALCPKQGSNKIEGVVLNRVCILGFFVLNMVRLLNPQRLTYTQLLIEYPPGFMIFLQEHSSSYFPLPFIFCSPIGGLNSW